MSSLLILSRMPVLGFNSEYRLRSAFAQQPDEEDDGRFSGVHGASKCMTSCNVLSIAGCIPGVSLVSGVYRLYSTYRTYQNTLEEAEENQETIENVQAYDREAAAAWLQDRKWTLIEMGVLGVAEICQLSIILAAAHLVKTIFDHIVAYQYRPEDGSEVDRDFQECIAPPKSDSE